MFGRPALDLLAQITTVLGFVLALAGYFNEARKRRNVERRERIRTWSDVAKLRALMTDLEKPLDSAGADFGKHQAVGKLTSMYRDKVATIFEITPDVDVTDLRAWRATGKICSDWQEACFWECFPQERIKAEQAQGGRFDGRNGSDELPDDHTMVAKPVRMHTTGATS